MVPMTTPCQPRHQRLLTVGGEIVMGSKSCFSGVGHNGRGEAVIGVAGEILQVTAVESTREQMRAGGRSTSRPSRPANSTRCPWG